MRFSGVLCEIIWLQHVNLLCTTIIAEKVVAQCDQHHSWIRFCMIVSLLCANNSRLATLFQLQVNVSSARERHVELP